MNWIVVDGTLTINVEPPIAYGPPLFLDGSWLLNGSEELDGTAGIGETSSVTIVLCEYTISSLADYISGMPGMVVEYESSGMGGLCGGILIDGNGNQDQTNGDHLYAFSSLLWSYMSSLSAELADAALAIIEMLKQMSLRSAEGFWLDELGSYYKVPRILGESDAAYGPRIVAETLRPKGNNFAIAAAIKEASGVNTSVIDAALLPVETNFFDGTWNFDGSRLYAIHNITSTYGLFDVLVEYDILGDANVTSYIQAVSEQVNRLRDAGTYMRQIGISGSSEIVDTYDAPITDSCEITITEAWRYDGSVRFDGSALFGSRLISTESI